MDSGCVPNRIFAAHRSNQIADLFWNLRPSDLPVPNFPGPVPTEPLTMPADDGFGLDYEQCRTPGRPQPGQQTHRHRSIVLSASRFGFSVRRSTVNWWRKAMFSACNAAWPRRPVRMELSVINRRSSTAEGAYQRLDANPTIQMAIRFSGRTISVDDSYLEKAMFWQNSNRSRPYLARSSGPLLFPRQ